jgi:hypothetical protein
MLAEYLVSPGLRFSWRGLHCAHFVAGWVRIVEGRCPIDMEASLRELRGHHPGDIPAEVSMALQRQPLPFGARVAQTGDIIAHQLRRGRWKLGIVNGRMAAFISEFGVVFDDKPLADGATMAWAVGR